ncbi:MAG: N-acetyltransferase family protein [Methanomassiliicoccales archaeon]
MPGKAAKLEIARVTPENADDLIALITELAVFEKLDPPTLEARDRLRQHVTSDPVLFHAFLGSLDGKAVGYITYYFTYSTFLAAPTLFLEDIYVQENVRKSGVGRELFKFCVQEAIDKGCGRMEWCALNWNVGAMRFYEKLGGRKLDWTFFRLDREGLQAALSKGQ